MDTSSTTCLVHLVRKANGQQPFSAFLDSYRRHDAGIDHELVVIFKGFEDETELDDYYNLLSDLPFRSLRVDDTGFDVGPYFKAVKAFEYQDFCFLNSYSVILDQGWLGKMHKHMERNGVGIVGATGSYESMFNNLMHTIPRDNSRPRYTGIPKLARGLQIVVNSVQFPRFPNHHIRVNAFMLPRELLLKIKVKEMRSKMDGYHFESGRESLTRQIFSMDLQALVVGRDGVAYEKEQWCESQTYMSGEQENLLVADNHTQFYEAADSQTKATLTKNTWGRC